MSVELVTQWVSPCALNCSVDPTISVNKTVESTRSRLLFGWRAADEIQYFSCECVVQEAVGAPAAAQGIARSASRRPALWRP